MSSYFSTVNTYMTFDVKSEEKNLQEKTKKTLLWMHLSHEPFVVLYALLPFIFRKDLNASLLQISILSALRPILPVFSFYWSAHLTNRKHLLRANLIGAWALARLPFLFIPWIENVWYLIASCAVYEFFNKSGLPALIEILKLNIPSGAREKAYTLTFVLSFLESILLGLIMAKLLDSHAAAWQILCGLTALLGLSSIFFQFKIPIPRIEKTPSLQKKTFKEALITPWKETFALLIKHPDFARFQYGFMIGGFSLMLIAPSLSVLCADSLRLTHSDMIIGRSILMGAGIVLSSYWWKNHLVRERVPQITQLILGGFALYLLLLSLSTVYIGWFYLAFTLYGIAQAGSHLLWNLSGTLFSEENDSSPFSRLNILLLGIRGAIAPALGGLLCSLLGPVWVIFLGSLLCFSGIFYIHFTETIAKQPTTDH